MSAGREYVEIEVKSVLNRVSGMPFRWSINPYRGCSHGCVFCLSGDTPVLLADSTTARLDELRIGDQIYGTEQVGDRRRYTPTFVLAHWSSVKRAYRIELLDGTQLIAGGDHRFLTDRGWKFVSGGERGVARRPQLSVGQTLVGTGAFAAPPARSPDYMRGYLLGVVCVDGSHWPGALERGSGGELSWRRLVLADAEVRLRVQTYLTQPGVPARGDVLGETRGPRRRGEPVHARSRACVGEPRLVAGRADEASLDWAKGFLAGVYDADGNYEDGTLRVSTVNPGAATLLRRCLDRLRFSYSHSLVSVAGWQSVSVVALPRNLREVLRFFHTVAPASTRKTRIAGQSPTRTDGLRIVAMEPAGERRLFDITTGTGDYIANGVVSHNCYARRTHWFLDEDGIDRWSTKIFAKVNAPAVLRRELSRPSWSRETVALGTATDPYQAIEGRYRITRGIVEALCSAATPVGIVTRSPLIQRDIDLLRRLTAVARATVCISIATTDEAVARQIEPGVAPPRQRLRTIARLAEAGIRCGVLLAPILPGLTDAPESLRAVIRAAREHGARFLNHTALHLGPVTRESFFRFLGRQHRDLIPRYERMYGGKYAPTPYRTELARTVEAEKTRAGIVAARYLPPAREPVQLELPLGDGPTGGRGGVPGRPRLRAGVRHRELGFGREQYVLTNPPDARSLPERAASAER